MSAISPLACERRPLSAKIRAARMSSPTVKDGRTSTIMTHPILMATPMSPEAALMTAQQFAEQARTLTKVAKACGEVADFLAEAGGMLVVAAEASTVQPSTTSLPAGVADFAAFRARRQAVSR